MASVFYGSGDRSVQGMAFPDLVKKAAEAGHIDDFEQLKYEELDQLRDSYARFNEPMRMLERLAEAGKMGVEIKEVLRDEARMALTVASAYFQRACSL